MIHRTILLLLACVWAASLILPAEVVHAQQPHASDAVQFEHFYKSDGLASDFIRVLLQDRRGFLWLGTGSGLDRYDGYTITHLLKGSTITALAEDHDGIIWVGRALSDGLYRFDPVTGTFTIFQHDPEDPTSLSRGTIRTLHVDRTGTLWVGTPTGLNRFNPDTGTFTHFRHDPDDTTSLSSDYVNKIYEDREGILWIGTEDGLNRFDGGPGSPSSSLEPTFIHYRHDPYDPYSLIDDEVWTINEDRQGTLYVGTCRHGLHRYDRIEDRFERLMYDPAHPARLHAPQGEDIPGSCGSEVRIIHEDAAGVFWVGTNGSGLIRFDPTEPGSRVWEMMTHYRHEPAAPNSLSSNSVTTLYEDRLGTLWIGTLSGGLNKVALAPQQWFRPLIFDGDLSNTHHVTSLLVDQTGRFWIGTIGRELYRYDGANHIPSATPIRLEGTGINDMIEDQFGMIWVGTLDGLHHIDPETGTFEHYGPDPNDADNLSAEGILATYEDSEGVLWFGTWNGLNRMTRMPGSDAEPNFAHYLPGKYVESIYEDREGVIWIGSRQVGSLDRYDRTKDRFTTVLEDIPILAQYEDTGGRFWIGTDGLGLLRYDRTDGTFTALTTADGLPHDIVEGIIEREDGYLWIVTSGGLSQFDPELERFVNYTQADGSPLMTTTLAESLNGELLTGGRTGVTIVSPDRMITDANPPEVVVTGLRVFDEPIQGGGLPASSVELDYHQNDLTFEYVGIHFVRPEKNRYMYQLEGYDTVWREVGTERTARYTSLDPGEYIFRVRAANADGVWNEEGASVRVTIHPPWWKTIWAYVVYGLLLLGAIFTADRIQRRRLIARERERARARELEQAREIEKAHTELQKTHAHLKATQAQLVQQEKLASLGELTAGIAHEIKNPLNFITNFAEVNQELAEELREALASGEDPDEIIDDLERNAEIINHHGKRADGIVSAMMQHASGGSGQREPTDVNALLEEYVNLAYHGKRAQKEGFNCEIERDYDEGIGSVEMIPQDIGRVFLNLLSNAFDAVAEQDQRTVRVQTRRRKNAIEIRVTDNGTGIPKDVRQKIFEPFFTTKPTGSGTGLGLSLSYDIITQGHGGTLTVESEEGKGATFVITLPTSL